MFMQTYIANVQHKNMHIGKTRGALYGQIFSSNSLPT